MDPFVRRYSIALVCVALIVAVWTFLARDPRVSELNALLSADHELADFPFQFRVIELEHGIATVSSPRSAEVPVMQFLRAAYPELAGISVDDPRMMEAQDRLVKKQSRAAGLLKSQDDVGAVRWQVDERWFQERGVQLNLRP